MNDWEIDWEAQWASFAPGFKDGLLQIGAVKLKPGPGFGDLSHPTTKLTLDLLKPLVKGKKVLDIGSGSGILSLVSYSLGANEVVGVDIELAAIEHAKMNAELNGFFIQFSLPSIELPPFLEGVIAMNMISSEQESAWKSLPRLEIFSGDLVISGLLKEEEAHAKHRFKERGWQHVKTKQSKEWIALHFKKGSKITGS